MNENTYGIAKERKQNSFKDQEWYILPRHLHKYEQKEQDKKEGKLKEEVSIVETQNENSSITTEISGVGDEILRKYFPSWTLSKMDVRENDKWLNTFIFSRTISVNSSENSTAGK